MKGAILTYKVKQQLIELNSVLHQKSCFGSLGEPSKISYAQYWKQAVFLHKKQQYLLSVSDDDAVKYLSLFDEEKKEIRTVIIRPSKNYSVLNYFVLLVASEIYCYSKQGLKKLMDDSSLFDSQTSLILN